jgi:hypothetical protein
LKSLIRRFRRTWCHAKVCVFLGTGYTIERVAMIADATRVIERETTLKLLANSYRVKHRAVRALMNARW